MPNCSEGGCSKAEIYSLCSARKYEPLLPCTEPLKRDKIKEICLKVSDIQYY